MKRKNDIDIENVKKKKRRNENKNNNWKKEGSILFFTGLGPSRGTEIY